MPMPREKFSENLFLIAIVSRVLLPNQRVGSYCEQAFPIFRPQRPKFKKIANMVRLQFETLYVLHLD
jgi:hypothetical protein